MPDTLSTFLNLPMGSLEFRTVEGPLKLRDEYLAHGNMFRPALLPGKPHGWRSLVGYLSGSHKKSNKTEHGSTNQFNLSFP